MIRVTFVRMLVVWLAGLLVVGNLVAEPQRAAAQGEMLEFSGATMGTRYLVKVFDPPDFQQDIQIEVDALLREINDQMSTYLPTSELSRFNASESTDWFEVSEPTATVVAFAQQVADRSNGAFDVTVGPLVNAWSFGPDPRSQTVPDAPTIERLRASVGYDKLSVRMDPPALRKSVPGLKVDLSAIAKGYGVDRVVQLLNEAGAANVFVEIGGEVRTSGSKAGQWWKVGIQAPDVAADQVLIAHSLNAGAGNDQSMATSGDYRNYFEVDGVRYSHTIDPRTGRPIQHSLASVSVVTETCMEADAWATALNVLGPDEGKQLAEQQGLSVLLIRREGDQFVRSGTGTLAQYGSSEIASTGATANVDRPDASNTSSAPNQSIAVAVITACAFGLILSAMAIGVMFGRRSISGSCGGLGNVQNEDGSVSCALCSNPGEACKELKRRMGQPSSRSEETVSES
jgi:thiamine biosynthesis lipoprotein